MYKGTSLMRKRLLLGPYRKPMPRVLGGSQGYVCFLIGEVPLQGSGSRVWGLGFRVFGFWFLVWGFWSLVWDLGCTGVPRLEENVFP